MFSGETNFQQKFSDCFGRNWELHAKMRERDIYSSYIAK